MQRAHTRLLHDTIVITDHLFSDLFSIQMVIDMECEVSSIASAHGALHCFEYAPGHGFQDPAICQLRKTRLRDQTDANSRDLVNDLHHFVKSSNKAVDDALCESYHTVDRTLECTPHC